MILFKLTYYPEFKSENIKIKGGGENDIIQTNLLSWI